MTWKPGYFAKKLLRERESDASEPTGQLKILWRDLPKKRKKEILTEAYKGTSMEPDVQEWSVRNLIDYTPLHEIHDLLRTFPDAQEILMEQMEEVIEDKILSLTDKDLAVIDELNNKISTMTSYGVTSVMATGKTNSEVSWSNAGASWRAHGSVKKGEEVNVDANEFVAPYSAKQVNKIAIFLDPLPLFYGSFEAKQQGLVGWEEGTVVWLKGQQEKLKRERGI